MIKQRRRLAITLRVKADDRPVFSLNDTVFNLQSALTSGLFGGDGATTRGLTPISTTASTMSRWRWDSKIFGKLFDRSAVPKITNPNYFLPIVEALTPGEVLVSGTTRPNVIRGICRQTQIKSDYVVKFRGAQRMSPEASARELVAAFMAMELDLNIPPPAIINISPQFAEAMRGEPNFVVACNSLGYNFGNEYVKEGYQTLIRGQKIPQELLERLQDLFAFDVLIGNSDRRTEKPNFLTNGKQELIFDHELAFGFTLLLPSAKNSEPWLMKSQEMEWIKDNYCYNALGKKDIDFSGFVAKLSVLNPNFWQKVSSYVPTDWQTNQLDEIKAHVETIVKNKDVFKTELNRILK